MKRFLRVFLIALSIVGLWVQPVWAQSTNNFRITSYVVDMRLGRDDAQRSTLSVKETITADFPSDNENHGLERAFVKQYDNHSLSFDLLSVTDGSGSGLNYHWEGDDLRIGDSSTYVHGLHTYVITYTMRYVTRYYADTGRDEFYWDAIGTEWQVPIDQASIKLTVDSSLKSAATGNTVCYWGTSGSTATCDLQKTDNGYAANVNELSANQGVTVAIGFAKGTFAGYTPSFWERVVRVWGIVQLIASPLAIFYTVWFVMVWLRKMNRKKELDIAPTEYLPPSNASVTTAAQIYGGSGSKVMTAQMLDLAVRHYIRLYETKEKTLFSPAEYEIEVTKDISDLRWEEQEVLKDMFDALPAVGQRLNLKDLKKDTGYQMRTVNNATYLTKLIRGEYGLREIDPAAKAWLRKLALVALIVGILLGSVFWLVGAALTAFVLSFLCWRLSDVGLALKRYLVGLKEYISMAEVDRIKLLQSPEGAEKVAKVANGTDTAQLITLYERVLPYAVLFGLEKDWNKQLGQYYETTQTSPDWYSGQNGAFNAAVFMSAMNGFSAASTAASSYSSSSGGSGGGGFSGGGGGGGGGGGW